MTTTNTARLALALATFTAAVVCEACTEADATGVDMLCDGCRNELSEAIDASRWFPTEAELVAQAPAVTLVYVECKSCEGHGYHPTTRTLDNPAGEGADCRDCKGTGERAVPACAACHEEAAADTDGLCDGCFAAADDAAMLALHGCGDDEGLCYLTGIRA